VTFSWAIGAGGLYDDHAFGIGVSSGGGSTISGRYCDTASFGTHPITAAKNANDLFVARLDKDGSFIGAASAGGVLNDEGHALALDKLGNAHMTGLIEGTSQFGSTILNANGAYDVVVAKTDLSGAFTWASSAGGTAIDKGLGIAVDGSGNSYVAGTFGSTVVFGADSLTAQGGSDVFVAKVDSDGKFVWGRSAGSTANDVNDVARSIAVDGAGNCYVTGDFSEKITFGATTLTSRGKSDLFVVKLDANGKW
jgi:hypothetical protein